MKKKLLYLLLLFFTYKSVAFGQQGVQLTIARIAPLAPTKQSPQFSIPQTYQSAQINLIHQKQEPNLCIPTSASIVLNKFGQKYSPRQIKALSRGKIYNPGAPFNDFTTTTYSDLVSGLKRVGIYWNIAYYENNSSGFQAGMTRIKNSIKYGYPVLISISVAPGYGHCIVACGFDDKERMITTMDPNLNAPGIRKMSYDYFEKTYWNSFVSHGFNYRLAVFMY